jgi:hypothetical protein
MKEKKQKYFYTEMLGTCFIHMAPNRTFLEKSFALEYNLFEAQDDPENRVKSYRDQYTYGVFGELKTKEEMEGFENFDEDDENFGEFDANQHLEELCKKYGKQFTIDEAIKKTYSGEINLE